MRHGENQSKHTPPVSTGGVYNVGVTPSKDSTPEPADGYAYLTDAEKADAIAAHAKAAAAKSKGSK